MSLNHGSNVLHDALPIINLTLMSNPEKYRPTPEEQAKTEKERTLSDADLLKKGAEYVVDELGEKRLEVTGQQIADLKRTGKKPDQVESLDFDIKYPNGDSLFEKLLEFAQGARTQRPDLFDPTTNTWTDWGHTRIKEMWHRPDFPEADFDKVAKRVERKLKDAK